MPIATIHRFNPFSLQHGSNHSLHVRIQEVIYYAESRFWVILNNISKADQERQSWTQKLLQRELVYYHFIYMLVSHVLSFSKVFYLISCGRGQCYWSTS